MKCSGKYKYKNKRANKWEQFECEKKYRCKWYVFKTEGRKIAISETRDTCSGHESPFKNKQP